MPACRAEEDLRRDAKGRHDHEGVVNSLEDPRRRVVLSTKSRYIADCVGNAVVLRREHPVVNGGRESGTTQTTHDLPGWTAHLRGPGIVKVESGGADDPTDGGRGDVW